MDTDGFGVNLTPGMLMWVGPVMMGKNFDQMKVVYDTGSDWLTVQGKKCTNCKGKLFDGSAGRQVETTQSNRAYGSASLDGYVYEDKVCLDERSCVSKFKYFLIEQ